MRKPRTTILGTMAALALAGGASIAYAQSRAAAPDRVIPDRVIHVPPGATVIVLPPGIAPMMPFSAASPPISLAGPALDAGFPFPPMPDAAVMMQQVSQMMAAAQQAFAAPAWIRPDQTVEAAMRQLQQTGGAVRGVFVTSFTDGHGTCTQCVTYGGNGTAPRVEVSATGNACASVATPMTWPGIQAPQRAAPRTWQVRNQVRPAVMPAPTEVAQLSR